MASVQGACAGCRASAADSMLFSGVLEGRGSEVAKWLQSPAFESQLFSFFPCSDPPSPVASPMRVCHFTQFKRHRAVGVSPQLATLDTSGRGFKLPDYYG